MIDFLCKFNISSVFPSLFSEVNVRACVRAFGGTQQKATGHESNLTGHTMELDKESAFSSRRRER